MWDGDSSSWSSDSPSLAGWYTSAVNKSKLRGIAVTVILFLVWECVCDRESVLNWHIAPNSKRWVPLRNAAFSSVFSWKNAPTCASAVVRLRFWSTLLRRWAELERGELLFFFFLKDLRRSRTFRWEDVWQLVSRAHADALSSHFFFLESFRARR